MSTDTGVDVEALLLTPELRTWLMSTARSLYKGHGRISAEDLAQEGWIAMWKASKNFDPVKGELIALVKVAARRRMYDVLRQERYYDRPDRKTPVMEIPVSESLERLLSVVDDIDAIVLAYHDGEIWRAINELPEKQRMYVILRFYQGLTDAETLRALNSHSNSVWCLARQRLSRRLHHLAKA